MFGSYQPHRLTRSIGRMYPVEKKHFRYLNRPGSCQFDCWTVISRFPRPRSRCEERADAKVFFMFLFTRFLSLILIFPFYINRQKMGNQLEDSILIQSLQNGHALEFERSDATRKLRLLLSELIVLISQVETSTCNI